MKILLGGVPFGSGNIGDEAILSCVVEIFRRNFPAAELVCATSAPANAAARYNVQTLPAYGFDLAVTMRDFRRALKDVDMFVWAGGTGLSDYPHIGATLLENAQKMKCKTVIWQVGMNRELNPEYFQLHGRKLRFAEMIGITRHWEKFLEKRIRERLQVCVSRCDLVILRDQPSLIELHTSGEFPAAIFGADSVILQSASSGEILTSDHLNRRAVGICIAEKLSKFKQQQAIEFMHKLQGELHVRLVFIPMTEGDKRCMIPVYEQLKDDPGNVLVNCREPAEVQSVVKSCSLLLSGRLQLTIMGLNALVPGIGVANSSKIANCLNMFGLPVFNNQSTINFNELFEECRRWLDEPDFAQRAADVRKRMLARLEQSEKFLRELA